MHTFNIYRDGIRTTATMPAYLVALLYGEGIDDVAEWLASRIDEEPEVWAWSAQWSGTVSGRLQAIAMRYVANPTATAWADRDRVGGDLPFTVGAEGAGR